MGSVPTLEQVRAYVRVPTTALSDEDLSRMREACSQDQRNRCTWTADTTGVGVLLQVVDQTATVQVRGATDTAVHVVDWGDYKPTSTITGNNNVSHIYGDMPEAHSYPLVVTVDVVRGDVIANVWVTIPDTAAAHEITFPDALSQALLRRIQREIAARNLPLGMVGVDAGEYGPERLPYYDALVEEHERAFRRVVLA